MNNMYTILINEDHSLIHTNRKRIMCGSNMIDSIRFLVNQFYNDLDMMKVNTVLEYKTPISKTYGTLVLEPSEELYKNKVEFLLPIDIRFTSESGELEFNINFTYLSTNDDGTFKEQVRPICSTSILIEDTAHWSDYISDSTSNLDNLTQIMLENQKILEQQKVYAEMIALEKADGIAKDEETNEIYLTSNGKEIGNRVKDEEGTCDCDSEQNISFEIENTLEIPDVSLESIDDGNGNVVVIFKGVKINDDGNGNVSIISDKLLVSDDGIGNITINV